MPSTSSSKRGDEALQALGAFLRVRFSSLKEAFFALDVHGKHQLTAKQFTSGLAKIGYVGPDTEGLFHAIDANGVGAITLPMFVAAIEPEVLEPPGSRSSLAYPAGPGGAQKTPPGVTRQTSVPSSAAGMSPPPPQAGVRTASTSSADLLRGQCKGHSVGLPLRSHSSEPPTNRRASVGITMLSPSASAGNWGSFRHTIGDRAVPVAPACAGREPVLLRSPQLTPGGTPRMMSRRSGGSPGPPGGPGSIADVVGAPFSYQRVVPPGSGRVSPRGPEAMVPSGMGSMGQSVPVPTHALHQDHRLVMEHVSGLKAQLAIECTERQIDCTALRVSLDDNMRQLRREVGERAREECQSCAEALQSTLRRDVEERISQAMSNFSLKIDALANQLRATAEDGEDARRVLEEQVSERCDRLNELLSATTEQSEGLQKLLEQATSDLRSKLAALEENLANLRAHEEEATVTATPPSDDAGSSGQLVELREAMDRRLQTLEAEVNRSLGFNVLVEGRIASLQDTLKSTVEEKLSQATQAVEPGKPLDTVEEIPLDRLESLERQVEALQADSKAASSRDSTASREAVTLAEQARAASLRMEEALEALRSEKGKPSEELASAETVSALNRRLQAAENEIRQAECESREAFAEFRARLPLPEKGRLCTMEEVQDVLQEAQSSRRIVALDRRLQAAEAEIGRSVEETKQALAAVRAQLPSSEGRACTLAEMETLVEANIHSLSSERSAEAMREESIRDSSRSVSKDSLGDTMVAFERRVQTAEERLGQSLEHSRNKLAEDLQKQLSGRIDEHLARVEEWLRSAAHESAPASNELDCFRTWTMALAPCLSGLKRPSARRRGTRQATSPPAPSSNSRLRKVNAGSPSESKVETEPPSSAASDPSGGSPHRRTPRLQPSKLEIQPSSLDTSMLQASEADSGMLESSHLLNVISALRSEVQRLQEEQGLADAVSSEPATPSADSTVPSFPSSRVLFSMPGAQLSNTMLSEEVIGKLGGDIHKERSPGGRLSLSVGSGGLLPSHSELEEFEPRSPVKGEAG